MTSHDIPSLDERMCTPGTPTLLVSFKLRMLEVSEDGRAVALIPSPALIPACGD